MRSLVSNQPNDDARAAILDSIRARLAESAPHDALTHEAEERGTVIGGPAIIPPVVSENGRRADADFSLVEMFRDRLEAVGGHCIVVRDNDEAVLALSQIIIELQTASPRVAFSNAPLLAALVRGVDASAVELTVVPKPADLFSFDVGITTAQAAIAETGTLVLESERERHRLISLLPPVHIALINSKDICLTLGEALRKLRADWPLQMSPAITFITGPSRTADIELTLTIGVHGPKEVYVIILDNPAPLD